MPRKSTRSLAKFQMQTEPKEETRRSSRRRKKSLTPPNALSRLESDEEVLAKYQVPSNVSESVGAGIENDSEITVETDGLQQEKTIQSLSVVESLNIPLENSELPLEHSIKNIDVDKNISPQKKHDNNVSALDGNNGSENWRNEEKGALVMSNVNVDNGDSDSLHNSETKNVCEVQVISPEGQDFENDLKKSGEEIDKKVDNILQTDEVVVTDNLEQRIQDSNSKIKEVLVDDEQEEGEICEGENEIVQDFPVEKVKTASIKVKLIRHSLDDIIQSSEDIAPPEINRKKWNSTLFKNRSSLSSLNRLSVEDIRIVHPELELVDEKELNLEVIRRKSTNDFEESKLSLSTLFKEEEKPEYVKQISNTVSEESKIDTNIIALNRKISIVDDSASKLKPPPSPAKQPMSPILYITNLVRPFTLKQLKGLLERTGRIREGPDGFWTDRIKSKCYVYYETTEEAEATRNALHGVNWPIGNGKKLIIEYSTEEEMDKMKNPPTVAAATMEKGTATAAASFSPPPPPPAILKSPPRARITTKENQDPVRNSRREEMDLREKRKEILPTAREWDLGKRKEGEESSRRMRRSSKSPSKDRKRRQHHNSRRSLTPEEDFVTRKHKKVEDYVPQRAMDDLFLKTKSTPSVYWQPLSPEEIATKQQQRLIRMEEHKRRLEENSRNRAVGGAGVVSGGVRDREPGRGAPYYRRRYD